MIKKKREPKDRPAAAGNAQKINLNVFISDINNWVSKLQFYIAIMLGSTIYFLTFAPNLTNK